MSSDPLVIFTPSGKRGRFPTGTPILTAARQLGVDIDSACGGRGICTKCQVSPSFGEFSKHGVTVAEDAVSCLNAVEMRFERLPGYKAGRRLGCQTLVQGDIVIDVPAESQVHKQVVRKAVEARDITLNPSTRLFTVTVEEPDMHDPSGDFERLQAALKMQCGIAPVSAELPLFKRLQPALRKGAWTVTVAIHLADKDNPNRIVEIWPGVYAGTIYGLAVDLGSTTIAAHLCDLQTGTVVASSGVMNPQIRFGEDLMSRVSYAMMNDAGADEMTDA
ncbi:MAG: drug:proton antiporter, partial [Pseudomonadota bacterium]